MFSKINLFFYTFGSKLKNSWSNFWSSKEITKKIIFTLLIISLYIVGTTITAPFVRLNANISIADNSFLNTLNLIGGGGLTQFSIFALGISPFINASLIMMILQSRLFPLIHKLTQSGPQGRRKLNIATRILTFIIAYPQAVFLTKSLTAGERNSSFITLVSIDGFSVDLLVYFLLPMILISASLFALFLSEQITNKGVGNGTSIIIMTGIAARLPFQMQNAFKIFVGDLSQSGILVGILNFVTYIFIYLACLMVIGIFYNAERRIPIQQTGAGRSKALKEIGSLPIKLNPAGIMPIIFAMLVLSLPTLIANILPNDNYSKQWINENLQFYKPLGFSLLIIITFVFSLLMGIQQSKVDKIAEDFAKNGTFIPKVTPGEETQNYLVAIVFRLSFFSAFYLVIIAGMQYVQIMTGILQPSIAFGGTSLMILVSVSIETISQLKARNKSKKLFKAKSQTKKLILNRNNSKNKKDSYKGLLW
ncbi:preprotein translocase subunit SecY [Mycoplasmopsis synoviae]|uniref:preprotein translocase subunit SecY n=1 Tax=Mycoplasmopsis synoviae TaxID=2109 RepID=UPI0003623635|nr:preprotein translocase subunit SecY [Mycoplasmopsis synoviae]AKB11303.1 preprotein translocase subunit SecY [Mycoplasmopsis synoviae ATCC 25204]